MNQKKKIGTITFYQVNNFGAELQAFALIKKLQQLGFDAEIIDYPFYKNTRHIRTKNSKPLVKLPLKKRIKEKVYPLYAWFKSLPYLKAKKKRRSLFNKFHQTNTKFSTIEYRKYEQLLSNKLDYEAIIVGSDQVWNPNLDTSLEPYLLNFVPENIKRISYAASFGVGQLPKNNRQFFKERFKKFNAISVREKTGQKIIKDLLPNKKTQHVLDPTLLLSHKEWHLLASSDFTSAKDYLLIYAISNSEFVNKLAKDIASKLNLKIIQITKDNYPQSNDALIENIIDVGPSQYLELFLNASFVITTSFHGTCFSINFNKPFLVLLERGKDNNSRQLDLLKIFDLESRVVFFGDENSFNHSKQSLLDNTSIDIEILEKERMKSINFLKTALGQ